MMKDRKNVGNAGDDPVVYTQKIRGPQMHNTRDLMKSNVHWRVFQCVLSFKNKNILFEEKSHWVKHQ